MPDKFLDNGKPIGRFLYTALKRGIMTLYVALITVGRAANGLVVLS